MRILDPRTIRRALSERAFREIDFSLVAPLRHASGFMLGAGWSACSGPTPRRHRATSASPTCWLGRPRARAVGWPDDQREADGPPGVGRPVAAYACDRPGSAKGGTHGDLVHENLKRGLAPLGGLLSTRTPGRPPALSLRPKQARGRRPPRRRTRALRQRTWVAGRPVSELNPAYRSTAAPRSASCRQRSSRPCCRASGRGRP